VCVCVSVAQFFKFKIKFKILFPFQHRQILIHFRIIWNINKILDVTVTFSLMFSEIRYH